MACSFAVGQVVERDIEEMWFKAVVEDVSGVRGPRQHLRLRYLDDGNVESGVMACECRPYSEGREDDSACYETKGGGMMDLEEQRKIKVVKKGETLMKPLAGLIDDDCDMREGKVPTAILHTSDDTEDGATIVLHGAEAQMAAGGGLRALRFLGGRGGRK